jgi:hypothetical protein
VNREVGAPRSAEPAVWYPLRVVARGPATAPEGHASRALIASRYEIEGEIGRGGMGTVLRVRDVASHDTKALKRLGTASVARTSERDRVRFRREFHTLAQLSHPSIVRVFDYGTDASGDFYTMELLEGPELRDLEPLEPGRACRLLRDVASALALLHARGVVHRDVAMRNVRLDRDGNAKLIDFGILATIGSVSELAGTLPHVPPEAVHGRPLDQRSDVYGLGALAFRLLTARHAHPARALDALPMSWEEGVPAPSTLAPSVPRALDELVLAMLSLDPLARPGSMAEVIERLSVIGGLPSAPAALADARGHLASAPLIGRDAELAAIREVIARTARGAGGVLLIEAPPGAGKSRLLREGALEAQLAGLRVARAAGAQWDRGPYGLLRAIVRELLASAPDDTIATARPGGTVIPRVLPELREGLAAVGIASVDPDSEPAEQRAQTQHALVRWMLELAALHPLMMIVDDLERADEASAAVLGALAHSAPKSSLAIVAALRTDVPPRAAPAVSALRGAAHVLHLDPLAPDGTEALARALFGDIRNVVGFARWLHEVSGGAPLHALEVASHLVGRGIVRFVGGQWLLPDEVPRDEVPSGLTAALELRIGSLGTRARAVAEVIAVHGGDVPLDVCSAAGAQAGSEPEMFAALDELVREELVAGDGETYRFRNEPLREVVLRGIATERRAAMHRALAVLLDARGDAEGDGELEVGWHYLHGGDRDRGATLLARAGRRLFEAQSFSDATAPLRAAVEVYAEREDAVLSRLELQAMLVFAGGIADRRTAMRYGATTVAELRERAGLGHADRLRPYVGATLALIVALVWASLRWLLTAPRLRGPSPVDAAKAFVSSASAHAITSMLLNDSEGLRALCGSLDAIAIDRHRIPYAAQLFVGNLERITTGAWRALPERGARILDIVRADRVTAIRPIERRVLEAIVHHHAAVIALYRQDRAVFDASRAALESLDLRMFDPHVLQLRALDHMLRGEAPLASTLDARAQLESLAAGSIWGAQTWRPMTWMLPCTLTHDVLLAQRCVDELARNVEVGARFELVILHARGEHDRLRGDLRAARDAFQRVLDALEALDEELHWLRPVALAGLAEAHLEEGDAQAAIACAGRASELMDRIGMDSVVHAQCCLRTAAIARARLGEVEDAVVMLEREIEASEPCGNPLLTGLLHEARAQVARIAGDLRAFGSHARLAVACFEPTGNPVLIARGQRLLDLAARRKPSELPRAKAANDPDLTLDATVTSGPTGPTPRA